MRVAFGSRDVGTMNAPATNASRITGTLIRNTEFHEKCWSSRPVASGPIAPAAPEIPAQVAIARARSCGGNTLTMIDSVAGITNAAPMPMKARHATTPAAESTVDATSAAPRNTTRPELQRALAAEAVTEGAGREQQAGEHERVCVHHPLQGAGGGAEIGLDRGQRDIERRVRDHHHGEAGAQHREDGPAAAVAD